MEKLWGEKHLCVFSEDEAKKWVLGWYVRVRPRGRLIRPFVLDQPHGRPRLHHIFTVLLQAVRLLRVSANLEAKANAMRREGLQLHHRGASRIGHPRKFWELMTVYFGTAQKKQGDEDDDPWDFLNAAASHP